MNGFVQGCGISSQLAMEILQSCTRQFIYFIKGHIIHIKHTIYFSTLISISHTDLIIAAFCYVHGNHWCNYWENKKQLSTTHGITLGVRWSIDDWIKSGIAQHNVTNLHVITYTIIYDMMPGSLKYEYPCQVSYNCFYISKTVSIHKKIENVDQWSTRIPPALTAKI